MSLTDYLQLLSIELTPEIKDYINLMDENDTAVVLEFLFIVTKYKKGK